jgi:hypothetical protein
MLTYVVRISRISTSQQEYSLLQLIKGVCSGWYLCLFNPQALTGIQTQILFESPPEYIRSEDPSES